MKASPPFPNLDGNSSQSIHIEKKKDRDTAVGIGNDIGCANNSTTPAPLEISTSPKLSTPKKKSGIFGASSNLVNSIVGAGIIGIPYAFRQSGLIAGLFLLGLVAFLTDKSLRMIVELALWHPLLKNHNVKTYEDLASYPFGKFGSGFILLNMFVLAYGAMVAYLLIIKDTVPTVLGWDNQLGKIMIMLLFSLGIMVPLSMQRDMASLAFTSLISVTADVILVFFVATYAPCQKTVTDAGGIVEVLKNDSINPTLFIGLGILSTAMACQHSCFIVSGSLGDLTKKRWATVTGGSIGISAILCAILGTFGYLGFLQDTQGDVLNNFDKDGTAANAARILLAITMFFTYPMESFVARHVIVILLHDGDIDGTDDPNYNGHNEAGGYLFLNRRQTLTFSIFILTLIPALLVDDLGPVLSITGSLGGSCISFIAPGLIYLGVNGEAFLSFSRSLVEKRNVNQSGTDGRNCSINDSSLPIAGDSNQIMTNTQNATCIEMELPASGSRIDATINNSRKPFWWLCLGFPIWCKIACIGSRNIKDRISDESGNVDAYYNNTNERYEVHLTPTDSQSEAVEDTNEDTVIPTGIEFCKAIFFIIFGTIGLVAGLSSNIYALMKDED